MREGAFVSIVMPALNEERHIEAAIQSIYPHSADFDFEIVVVDGGSSDRTVGVVNDLSKSDPRIRCIHNPRRVQSAAVNLAARVADPRSTVLLRADCHAEYPPGFVATCLKAMQERGCASVVVPMLTVGAGCLQSAIAAAQNSRLGNGGSLHRLAGSSGYVDHGHHAAFDLAAFTSVGGYAEDMKANEDAELDHRLGRAGHKLWLCGEATIKYFPRASVAALARQYFAYGWGRATTCIRHRAVPRLRQVAPVLALLATSASLLGGLFDPRFLSIAVAYAGMCFMMGAVSAWRERSACLLLAGPMAIVMHLSWGAGFLARLFDHLRSTETVSGSSGISRT